MTELRSAIRLSGHVKTGQQRSGQNRPTEMAGASLFYPADSSGGKFVFVSPGARTAFEHMNVMEQSIQHGGYCRTISPEFAPVR
jgi:hypothetical protein